MVRSLDNQLAKAYRRLMWQGFSLLMFGGTIWVLLSRRSTHQVNRFMLTVACLLLMCSTVVRVSWFSCMTEIDFFACPAHHNWHYKGYGRLDIVRRPYSIFIGRFSMDVRDQELCVCYTIANRGQRHGDLLFLSR